jgi:glycosyltransferase involved in cell wall biosynthesis
MTTDATNFNSHPSSTTPVIIPMNRAAMALPSQLGKVLHLINGEHYSGAERVQDLLAQRLPENGFGVGLACVKPGKFPELCEAESAQIYLTPMKSRWDIQAVKQICRIVRDEPYDILHAHTPRTAMLGALVALRTGRPLVYHVHSPTSRDSTRWLQNILNRYIESVSLKRATKLITVSNSLAGHMKTEGFRDDQIRVVPNGVPLSDQQRSNQLPTDTWTIGSVALIRPRKGMEVLLTALAILRKEGLPVKLRAVGPFETEEYGQSLKHLVEELELTEAVEWTGFCKDVNAELTQMDLFVLPSLFGEGLPMVVLEAMAAGVPVVSTFVEGVPEAVRDGRDGVLAKAGDAEDLARAIRSVVRGELDWQTLRQSAIERHAVKFSDASMASGCAAVYAEILALEGQR